LTADDYVLTKTFGTGIAYPIRTNDGMKKLNNSKRINPRADSFSLYCGWVGDKVLSNLLPKSVLNNNI
jgi:hypothetical protein